MMEEGDFISSQFLLDVIGPVHSLLHYAEDTTYTEWLDILHRVQDRHATEIEITLVLVGCGS